jgi:hypothetical protein
MQENKNKNPFDITYMFIIANRILLKYTQKMEQVKCPTCLYELFSLIFYWKYSIFLHEIWRDTYFHVIEEWRQRYGKGHLEIRKNENKRHKYI